MGNSKPLKTDAEHKAALARIYELMDARPGTLEGGELDALVGSVEVYESENVDMGYPGPVAAIDFRMEQAGLSPRDLVSCIGSQVEVAEVLSGKRAITPLMAQALHKRLGIPVETLLRPPTALPDDWSAAYRRDGG